MRPRGNNTAYRQPATSAPPPAPEDAPTTFPHDAGSTEAAELSDDIHSSAVAAHHMAAVTSSSPAAETAQMGALKVALDQPQPAEQWRDVTASHDDLRATLLALGAQRLDEDSWVVDASLPASHHVALATSNPSLIHDLQSALRADSPDAPSTHAEAAKIGEPWLEAELKEFNNHTSNGSWEIIKLADKPPGRRLHKFVWVFKVKRDGTAKARLCVQGCTLQSGIDYDQTFSATLRYSSARALFAYAAKCGCEIRSIDYVAAYLQGDFIEGETVYCHMPPGYEKYDDAGKPYVCKILKPIYGIPQAGRRLQRKVFPWMVEAMKLRQLDDSDACVFVYDDPRGLEHLAIGVYVDNLQVVHSAKLDENGDAVDKSSKYHEFITQLRKDWDIVDEGPMVDLLAIEVERLPSGSIKLHQKSYITKLLAKYLPNGPPSGSRKDSLPYSDKVLLHVIDAIDGSTAVSPSHPGLVKTYQERLGALLYLATSTRADLAFIIPLLCRAMSRPTPELISETERVFTYLYYNQNVGLTYDSGTSKLHGFSDASWEVRSSTSGWTIFWQGCTVSWGSRKQNCTALSSCEAEIIALSEACKDMVYVRKLANGLDPSYAKGPCPLATDNMGARALSYNPEFHDKTKHVERRHFFIRDMVEKFEVSVPFVSTLNNWADFFTKPLKPKVFFAMRKIIMNEP